MFSFSQGLDGPLCEYWGRQVKYETQDLVHMADRPSSIIRLCRRQRPQLHQNFVDSYYICQGPAPHIWVNHVQSSLPLIFLMHTCLDGSHSIHHDGQESTQSWWSGAYLPAPPSHQPNVPHVHPPSLSLLRVFHAFSSFVRLLVGDIDATMSGFLVTLPFMRQLCSTETAQGSFNS